MACRFLGFSESPISAQEVAGILACLPEDFRQSIKEVNYRSPGEFGRGFKLLGSEETQILGVVSGQDRNKTWDLIGYNKNTQANELAYVARFVPGMVRQACCLMVDKALPGLNLDSLSKVGRQKINFKHTRAGLIDILFGALTVNISQPDRVEWQRALAMRLLAHSHDYAWVDWALSRGLKSLAGPGLDYAASSYKIRQIQKNVIKRCASQGVKRIIKSKFDQPYQRSVWMDDILSKQSVLSVDRASSLPHDVAVSLRVLVQHGEPAHAGSVRHLIDTLRVL